MTHDFNDDLAYSHGQADKPWWAEVYRAAFPDMVAMADLRHDGWHQKAGRDRAIVLSSGRTLYVDEKVRRLTYPDIALEVWSVYPKHLGEPYAPIPTGTKLGWARKPLDCDYLAYAFEQAHTCYLLPFYTLRAAMDHHLPMFCGKAMAREDGYRWVVAENRTYNTISIAVPLRQLMPLLQDAMTVGWKAAA